MSIDFHQCLLRRALGVALAGLGSVASAGPVHELDLMGLGESGSWKALATATLGAGSGVDLGEAKAGKAWARVSLQKGEWLVEIGCGGNDIDQRSMKVMGSNKGDEPIGRCEGSWVKAAVGPSSTAEPATGK